MTLKWHSGPFMQIANTRQMEEPAGSGPGRQGGGTRQDVNDNLTTHTQRAPQGVPDPGNPCTGLPAHLPSVYPACSLCQAQGRLLDSVVSKPRVFPALGEREKNRGDPLQMGQFRRAGTSLRADVKEEA